MAANRLLAGASGYSFKEWKGSFYPEKIKQEAMLEYYSAHLPTVEINSSFYGLPKLAVLERWAESTPPDFRFSIKAPKQITHISRLAADAVAGSVELLYSNLAALGDKRGPVLFQLPPSLKLDVSLLRDFLALLPKDHRAAFEFRNESWFCRDVHAALEAAGASLCFSEREGVIEPPPLVETTGWGYVRLRLESYSEADLKRWSERLAATKWQHIVAYFMHEPTAPNYAQTLMRVAAI